MSEPHARQALVVVFLVCFPDPLATQQAPQKLGDLKALAERLTKTKAAK